MNKNIVISTKTILLTLAILAGIALLYQIKDILLQLFIALIMALSIEHGVKFMVGKKLPRWIAVTLLFITMLLIIGGFVTIALPLVITQTTKLIQNFPSFIESVIKDPNLNASINSSISQFTTSTGSLITIKDITINVFSNAFAIIT